MRQGHIYVRDTRLAEPAHHKYHTETWGYQLDAKRKPRVAKSLDDPHCVFSRLKTFVSRYTLETGERITGIPADQIRQIAEMMARNRPGSILYSLGMTQHTTGVQGIRSFTILQLLLGNIGKPGGGIDALRTIIRDGRGSELRRRSRWKSKNR